MKLLQNTLRCGFMLLVAVLLVFACGCGQKGPKLGRVEGTVTLDGKPLAGAIVTFVPINGGRNSVGQTDESGHYELEFAAGEKGAIVGRHKVQISLRQEAVEDDRGNLIQPERELIPAKYNIQTVLEVEVKPGNNKHDFKLSSR